MPRLLGIEASYRQHGRTEALWVTRYPWCGQATALRSGHAGRPNACDGESHPVYGVSQLTTWTVSLDNVVVLRSVT